MGGLNLPKMRVQADIIMEQTILLMYTKVSKLEVETEEILNVESLLSKEVTMDCSGCNRANREKDNTEF